MLMYTKDGDHMRVKGTDMMELSTKQFEQSLQAVVEHLCDSSGAPGDAPDMLAQAIGHQGEGMIAYLHAAMSAACANGS